LKLAAAETEQAPSGTKWIRAVLLADNYVVIWDDLQGDREHTYDWFFHAFGDKLDLSGTTANRPAGTQKNGEFPYPFISNVRAQQLTNENLEANWLLSDKTGLKLWLLGETNDLLFTANCPTTDGKTIPMIVLRKKSEDCQFVSVLEPWKKTPVELQISADRSDPNHLRLTIKQPERTDVISFKPTNIQFDYDSGGSREKLLDASLTAN
jgi:hypothetical protein